MLTIDNEMAVSLHVNLLEEICKSHSTQEVELIIVDHKAMHELNLEHRGVDKTTDVLSFPVDPFPHAPLGSIIINHELAQEKANELGHSLEDEIALLFIHGMLHLLGFDHEVDQGEMRAQEELWIKQYHLPASLIVRTEG